ncbi:hypothetical protein GCM10010964_43480 [Caldovatus sediminis]|uniref:DNA primase/polymerase bifunctional N-terminal domain-containing protein n=1 Tax=Caldovatus sediminis TaxID=2041189 RepID=A0A8J2ZFV6_9PROT|nr:bifunctional DNA primase/polymerase [Caldovatus sediminis]GGG51591.1 hypothetical protein GCM10010964_43480 [Caldovatus sediminis]
MTLPTDLERLARLGWHLVPQARRSRAGLWKGYRLDASHDLATLARWHRDHPGANWAVATGPGSGVWALDVDVPSPDHAADGIAALRALVERHGPIPPRPMLRSGGGGLALFFAWTAHAPARSRTGWPEPGLDVRGPRVVTTVPPSRHRRTGRPYRWIVAPWELPPPPAPDWLLRACAPPPPPPAPAAPIIATTDRALRRLDRAVCRVLDAPAGTRNATLNREAFVVGRWLGAGLLGETEAASALYAAARRAGLDDAEARATIRSGLRAGASSPLEARA